MLFYRSVAEQTLSKALFRAALSLKRQGILFMALFPLFVQAQQFSVHLKLDTSQIAIGEQTILRVMIEKQNDIAFDFPPFRDSIPAAVELLNLNLVDSSVNSQGRWGIQYAFLITSFDSGTWVIPSMPFAFATGEKIDTLWSVPLYLEVKNPSVEPDKDIFDIKAPLDAPVTFAEIIFWSGLVMLSLMIITIGLLLFRRLKQKKPVVFRQKPAEPADLVAIRALDALQEKKLWQQGQIKAYYTELTDIIRIYIENRFQVPAMEQTSTEILQSMRFTSFDDESTFRSLEQLLVLADLVKFAKELPLPDENEANLLNAYVFVNRTKPAFSSSNLEMGKNDGNEARNDKKTEL